MRDAFSKRPVRLITIGVALMLVFALGSTVGAQSTSGKMFYACEGPFGIIVLTSSVPRSCPKGTTLTSWSQVGPMGPEGPAGPPAIMNVYHRSNNIVVAPMSIDSVRVTCDDGDMLTGGGFVLATLSGMRIIESRPLAGGWEVIGGNDLDAPATLMAFAMCASSS